MGKVGFLKLYPLSYREFLMATGKEQFAELLAGQDYPMITSFQSTYIDALKQYYFVGGMPEAVQSVPSKRTLTKCAISRSVFSLPMSRTFPNMRQTRLCPK